jgi:hypothetical protein
LAGRVEQADRTTGEVRQVYDSEREPDGVLLKACGTRRESRCPSCAATYRADAYQLLAAGLKGGKGVPETVASHPRLFVTFTAPSFGRVHTRKAQGRLVLPCHPYRQGARCLHGLRDGCWHRHDDDTRLGEPLCPACYDAEAQVLWNALAPELWRRTTIAIQRALGRLVGLQEHELRRLVRISYAKVAEFQRRGAIHFHAVIRLDAATACRCPACLAPPPEPFTSLLLEDALHQAIPAVQVPCPPVDDGPDRYARWGEQLDVRNITRDSDQAGELSAEQVAGYIAKYATKATESFGAGLDRRLTDADDLEHLDKLPTHVAELVRAAWELGGCPELAGLRLRAWAHMLGFGGHWSTKSRRYSTTMGALRRARVAFARRRRAKDGVPLDAWGRPEDDQAVLVLTTWTYVASGYATEGERWLALSAAARAREQRRVAWEELRTTAA